MYSELSDIFKVNKVNYLQKTIIQKMHSTVRVPAFEFKFNLVVCPLQGASKDVSKLEQKIYLLNFHLHRVTASSMF